MARFVVVLPLHELATGDAFPVADWPLHVTLVEPFVTELTADPVAALVGPALGGASMVMATAGARAGFGRRGDVPVTLVGDDHGALAAMRRRVLDALREADVDVARARLDYRPHVTAMPHGEVQPGATVRLEQVALIDMQPAAGAGERAVAAVWALAAERPRQG